MKNIQTFSKFVSESKKRKPNTGPTIKYIRDHGISNDNRVGIIKKSKDIKDILKDPESWTDDLVFVDDKGNTYFIDDLIGYEVNVAGEEFEVIDESAINEITYGFTKHSRADQIFDQVDEALKGGVFYYFNLNQKVFMKPGGKRQVQAEKFSKYIWVTTNNERFEDNGNSITFSYDYKEFSVDKRYVEEQSAEDYLHWWIDMIFKQMHTNSNQDSYAQDDAWAAGTTSHKPKDNVNPYIDAGFLVAFAKKYKINLKKHWDASRWTLSYKDLMDYAKKYPFK